MVSDLPTSPRLAYVGTDHYRAGRTAAFFVSRMARRPGPVIVLTHSFDYRAHAERVSGFRDGLVDHGPDMRVVGVLEGHDRQVESEELVVSKMRSIDEDIVGLYNTGGANRAVERASPRWNRRGGRSSSAMSLRFTRRECCQRAR